MCCLAYGELSWLFLEPDAGLSHCPRILLSCFRARTSVRHHVVHGEDWNQFAKAHNALEEEKEEE